MGLRCDDDGPSRRDGCTYISLSEEQIKKPGTDQKSKHNSCWDDDKWRAITGFVCEHPTDTLLALFTGLLVVIGGWQGYQLKRTVDAMKAIDQGQSEKIARSIAEASRAASAMEGVAEQMRRSVIAAFETAEAGEETARAGAFTLRRMGMAPEGNEAT